MIITIFKVSDLPSMKKLLNLLPLLLLSVNLCAQKPTAESLVIQGKLSGSPERMLKIFFVDEKEKTSLDTIHLDKDGAFYFKTTKITRPQRTSIQMNQTQINQIYVAPGYELTITGDATDYKTLFSTKKISGKGSLANRYRVKLDSTYASRPRGKGWYEMNLEELLVYIKMEKKLQDSIYKIVFAKKPAGEKYFDTFKNMISVDNQSIALYTLLEHIIMNKYSPEKMTSLVQQHTPEAFKKGISNDAYLNAEDYKTWLLGNYLSYRRQLDKLKDSTLSKQTGYGLKTIQEAFNGKVRDYYLYKVVTGSIGGSKSIEALNASKKRLEPYLATLADDTYKLEINASYSEKEKQLMQVQIGKPAPDFTLISADQKTYRLADFKGKVVYIDLWASWCVPCRKAMPDYKKLYDKHKDNAQMAFLGIAVSDGEKEWRQALKEENPNWIQLHDKEGIISRSYIANAIPKYIIIDKQGKIVSFDAPGPEDPQAEKLLLAELSKE